HQSRAVWRSYPAFLALSLHLVVASPVVAVPAPAESEREGEGLLKSDDDSARREAESVDALDVAEVDSHRSGSAPLLLPSDQPLDRYRSPFDALLERAIAESSVRVRYPWRRSKFQLSLQGGLPVLFNQFESSRLGLLAAFPQDDLLWELGLSRVWVSESVSSELLAQTPYRQAGRPERVELSFGVTFPLAEGVVTLQTSFLPAAQLLLTAHGQLRQLIYFSQPEDADFTASFRRLLSTRLNNEELEALEGARPAGMLIDQRRYQLDVGLGLSLYFQSGFFLAQRFLLGTPVGEARGAESALRLITEAQLLFGLAI
ncbi:MAG: hypothetical protein VYD19_06920, partial [Myxococcota bacterium]|nr:hypothetical protein [Myxococcota bacterium]